MTESSANAASTPTPDDEQDLLRFLSTRASGKRMSFSPQDMHILVIDDEKVSRLVIQRLLERAGYTHVRTVESGEEGLKALKGGSYQLVLVDVKMPGMNGIQFLEHLIEDPTFNFDLLTVVMVSAIDELQLVYQCLNLGASDFLTKPIRPETVQNLWQTVWRKRKETELRRKYTEMEGQSQKKMEEIEKLQSQMTEAIKTPVKAITDTVASLIDDGSLTDSAKATLAHILKSIHSSHIYRPVLEDLVVSTDTPMDSQTRAWLLNEFKLGTRHSSTPDAISLAPPTNEETQKLRNWDFDVWQISDDMILFHYIQHIFQDFNLLETYKISVDKFRRFLFALRKLYHDRNPYHNFRHAFDVLHMVYLLLTNANAAAYLSTLEVFALLLAALLHDVDHPGLNNSFLIATESPLALSYNDQSVLENHHCSTGFKLLMEVGFFETIDVETKRKLRKMIVHMILGTDLSHHVASLNAFESLVKSGPLDKENEEHRAMMAQMIIKAADLSNPARPFHIAKYWAYMVQEEFFLQGEREKEKGLKVSPYMSRGNSSLPQMQINFTDFIVVPIFKLMAIVLPSLEKSVLRQLADNRVLWQEYLKAEKESAPVK